jgi:hypothetical protein
MDYIVLVQVIDCVDDLARDPGALLLRVLYIVLDIGVNLAEQFSTLQVLETNVYPLLVFKVLAHFYDIGVVQSFDHVYFFFVPQLLVTGHEALLHYLDSSLLSCNFMLVKVYFGESPLAKDSLANVLVFKN